MTTPSSTASAPTMRYRVAGSCERSGTGGLLPGRSGGRRFQDGQGRRLELEPPGGHVSDLPGGHGADAIEVAERLLVSQARYLVLGQEGRPGRPPLQVDD